MNQRSFSVLVKLMVAAACVNASAAEQPAPVSEFRPGLLIGYLSESALPNSLALLPPPPQKGSAALALDQEIARRSAALQATPRWKFAAMDADLHFPAAAGTFSCALKVSITKEQTPFLYQLLRRTLTDAGLSTYTAKEHYKRTRPFMANKQPICTPDEKALLEKDGSYPSGHTAVGWAWALILTTIYPEQADALLARGAAYGESRSVCNVHWHSDVVQGRIMGAATVARLHAEPAFRADLEAAKAELAAARAKGISPVRECADEAAAFARK